MDDGRQPHGPLPEANGDGPPAVDASGDGLPAVDASGEESFPSLAPAVVPRRRSRATKWLVMVVFTLIFGGLDQVTKHWAQTTLRTQHRGRLVVVDGYVALHYVRNPGAAWGFLSRKPASFRRPFFLIVSVIAMGFILYLFVRLSAEQWLLMMALSLVMSGAIGNFIDRVRHNYVIDFLDFHIRRAFKWPTFNVADVAISAGVALLFVEMIVTTRQSWRNRRLRQRAAIRRTGTDEASAAPPASHALDDQQLPTSTEREEPGEDRG